NHLKTAIVHEWLVNYAGSEKCVESFTNICPDATVYSLVDFLNEEQREIILKGKFAQTSFIQKLPSANTRHRYYLPLFPKAIESFDLSDYDIIISSSHAVAKGVKTNKKQLHISYCYSPMRYAWDNADEYLKGFKGSVAKLFIKYLRRWDLKSSKNPDYIVAISEHIRKKIKRIYNRDADVIYPPVDTDKFQLETNKSEYYLAASRLVPYKKIDLIIDAFAKMLDKKLVVIGSGPEKEKIIAKATPNIDVIGYQDFESLKSYMQKAKAFVFAAEEDFGIVVVEAMACGTPVIAFGIGGAAETVVDGVTGILFPEQTVDSIVEAVKRFDVISHSMNYKEIRLHSERFSRQTFERNIKDYVNEKLKNFQYNKVKKEK
ncbi:MAG TPA: glycosyltransferase, partial [Ignavibacteriaceae bacterium]|nr:glycosyltransferase [Ignavibacteriaceae bacterium]